MTNRRPISPHLQIYKPQITSVLSILHRITGMILSTAIIAVIVWLIAIEDSAETFYKHQHFYNSIPGKCFILLWLSCFYYHLCNGIRHLAWDCGYGFEIRNVERSGIAALSLTSLMTIITIIVLF